MEERTKLSKSHIIPTDVQKKPEKEGYECCFSKLLDSLQAFIMNYDTN